MVVVMLFAIYPLMAQSDIMEFHERSLAVNNVGMGILGGWALANIATGAIGWANSDGQRAYFHQMNLFWNVVNLSIAGIALVNNFTFDYATRSAAELLEMQHKVQGLFLINAGLDLAYMGTGVLLRHLSDPAKKSGPRLMGYGEAVILQGAFLFVFDLVLYAIQRGHRTEFMEHLALSPAPKGLGLALKLQF